MRTGPTWIVLADGGSARFIVRRRPGAKLEELVELAETADPIERPSSRPVRTHDRMGRSGHTVFDRTTPRDATEMEFLRRIAAQIDSVVARRRVGELVLCAPPRALGLLRDFISAATRKRLTAEIVKDIVREPLDLIDHRMKENRV